MVETNAFLFSNIVCKINMISILFASPFIFFVFPTLEKVFNILHT